MLNWKQLMVIRFQFEHGNYIKIFFWGHLEYSDARSSPGLKGRNLASKVIQYKCIFFIKRLEWSRNCLGGVVTSKILTSKIPTSKIYTSKIVTSKISTSKILTPKISTSKVEGKYRQMDATMCYGEGGKVMFDFITYNC
jgi:hypothetical protein